MGASGGQEAVVRPRGGLGVGPEGGLGALLGTACPGPWRGLTRGGFERWALLKPAALGGWQLLDVVGSPRAVAGVEMGPAGSHHDGNVTGQPVRVVLAATRLLELPRT